MHDSEKIPSFVGSFVLSWEWPRMWPVAVESWHCSVSLLLLLLIRPMVAFVSGMSNDEKIMIVIF